MICCVPPSGDSAADLCSGLPGVRGVPGRLQGLPVRAALPRQLCLHGKHSRNISFIVNKHKMYSFIDCVLILFLRVKSDS